MLLTEKANIFVSSDNDEFLEIASSFGVHAIKRPIIYLPIIVLKMIHGNIHSKMRSFDSYKFCIVLPCTSFRSLKYFSDIASFFQKGCFFTLQVTKVRRNPGLTWFNQFPKNSSFIGSSIPNQILNLFRVRGCSSGV